jgi:flagellar hook-basal body complex protein FliE
MANILGAGSAQLKILDTLKQMQHEAKSLAGGIDTGSQKPSDGKSFADHLKDNINEVNAKQVSADKMAMELATGQSGNIHETMIAATQAELQFNLMVQLRNKALEAYTEVMRMPV